VAAVFFAVFLAVDVLLAAVVEVADVAVVPFFSAQEVKNAMPIKAVIKNKTDFFIGCI